MEKQEISNEELEKLVFIYKSLDRPERNQMVYGANLLYASQQARNKEGE